MFTQQTTKRCGAVSPHKTTLATKSSSLCTYAVLNLMYRRWSWSPTQQTTWCWWWLMNRLERCEKSSIHSKRVEPWQLRVAGRLNTLRARPSLKVASERMTSACKATLIISSRRSTNLSATVWWARPGTLRCPRSPWWQMLRRGLLLITPQKSPKKNPRGKNLNRSERKQAQTLQSCQRLEERASRSQRSISWTWTGLWSTSKLNSRHAWPSGRQTPTTVSLIQLSPMMLRMRPVSWALLNSSKPEPSDTQSTPRASTK